jgi:Uma2 family endonuclease
VAEAEPKPMTLDEFNVWEDAQDARHEFVNGEITLMTGGTQAHALIAANLIALLRPRLRGSPCRPCGSDLRVEIPTTGNARYPDVTVDCGPFRGDSHVASEPAVLFEILSKTTATLDVTDKLWDYGSRASIKQYVCLHQDRVRILVWTRNAEGKLTLSHRIVEATESLTIHGVGEPLALVDIYEGTGLL